MKKLLSIALAISTIGWFAGTLYVPVAKAAVIDGDIVSSTAAFTDADGNTYQAYDVFIIKIVGSKLFKRLILNPAVFTSYGHLKWSNLKKISAAEIKTYTTSSLVRPINDTKVYKLMPDGDTGTKQWVDDLACFNSKGYDWDSVYIINATDSGNYTTGGSICGGISGQINVSLASDNPSAATIPYNAYGVTYDKFNISGSGTISQLVLTRHGAGVAASFDAVYLFENGKRLTAGRSISSSTNKVTFINLSITAPTTISVVADLAYIAAGYQDYFSIDVSSDVVSTATVGGSFPINGNPMATSAAAAGTLTVARNGATGYNVTVGTKEAEVSAFKVSPLVEGTKISRVQLYQGGTVATSNLTNLKLKTGGVTVATASGASTDGYIVFNLSTPKEITKGNDAIFYVYADVAGKPAETIKLYLDIASDITGIGTTYGYGMKATITNYASGILITATLVGGDLTMVKSVSGAPAASIGRTTTGTDFLELTMSAAADITVSRTRLAWCADIAANGAGTYDVLTGDFKDVENTEIINKDTGAVWAGPQDGSAFILPTTAATGGLCPGAVAGLYKDFTDTFDLSAGQSYNLKVTADVTYLNTSDASTALSTGSLIKIIWVSYGTLVTTSGTVNYMKYTGTNNAVTAASIVPSGDIAGEEMTLAAPSLTVALAATPSGADTAGAIGNARTFVTGQTGASVVGFILTASDASAIDISALSLTGYVDCDANGTYVAGLEDTNCYLKNLVSSVEIWDTTTNALVPGSSAKSFTGTSYETVAYNGLDWTIPAGASRTLLVKANLSSIVPTTSFDMFSFDIADVSADITAQDKDGNTVTVADTYDAVNAGQAVAVAVYPYGSVTVAAATDTPDQNVLIMGTSNNEVSKIKLTGSKEGFNIQKFSVDLSDTAITDDFTGLALKYQTLAQQGTSNWTISSKKGFPNKATLSFDFSGADRPYVPKDDSTYVTVLADILGYNAGQGAGSGDYFKLTAATDDASVKEFQAYGAQSGSLVTSVTEPTSGFNYQYIFRGKPFFEKGAWSGDDLELARFSVTAVGYDVTFDGTSSDGFYANDLDGTITDESVVSANLEFDVLASGTDSTIQTLYLYDWNNSIISSVSDVILGRADFVTDQVASTDSTCSANELVAANNEKPCLATVSFGFEAKSTAVVIANGTTKTFYVLIDNSVDFNNQDEYISLKLKQDEGDAAANTGYDNCQIVWYDGSDDEGTAFEHRICMPANMKNIGAFPFSFRQLRGASI